MLPTKERFIAEIMNSVNKITDLIIDSCSILDFEGILRDEEKYGFKVKK